MILRLHQLHAGDQFRFEPTGLIYTARGNGWYMGQPYDGGPWHRADCDVYLETRDVFELRNDPSPHRPDRFENSFQTRQKKLLDGMNCLPGQQDLF